MISNLKKQVVIILTLEIRQMYFLLHSKTVLNSTVRFDFNVKLTSVFELCLRLLPPDMRYPELQNKTILKLQFILTFNFLCFVSSRLYRNEVMEICEMQ